MGLGMRLLLLRLRRNRGAPLKLRKRLPLYIGLGDPNVKGSLLTSIRYNFRLYFGLRPVGLALRALGGTLG